MTVAIVAGMALLAASRVTENPKQPAIRSSTEKPEKL